MLFIIIVAIVGFALFLCALALVAGGAAGEPNAHEPFAVPAAASNRLPTIGRG
jgi:hypothetical protein